MAIIRRGHSWQVSLSLGGKRIRRAFKSHDDAAAWEADCWARFLRGEKVHGLPHTESSPPMTLSDLQDQTWEMVWKQKGSRLPYTNAGRVIKLIGPDLPIDRLTPQNINQARQALLSAGKTPATANRHIAALSRMLSLAADMGWIAAKPRCKLESEAGNARHRWLSLDEEKQLLKISNEVTPKWSLLWLFLLDTGMRRGAALDLTWEYINLIPDWEARVHVPPHITKTRKGRVIPLTSRLRASLRLAHQRQGKQLLSSSSSSSSVGPFAGLKAAESSKAWNQIRTRMGLDNDPEFVPHILRHTFCSRLAQSGSSPIEIMQLSGHSSLSQVQRYAHLCTPNADASMSRLDQWLDQSEELYA